MASPECALSWHRDELFVMVESRQGRPHTRSVRRLMWARSAASAAARACSAAARESVSGTCTSRDRSSRPPRRTITCRHSVRRSATVCAQHSVTMRKRPQLNNECCNWWRPVALCKLTGLLGWGSIDSEQQADTRTLKPTVPRSLGGGAAREVCCASSNAGAASGGMAGAKLAPPWQRH